MTSYIFRAAIAAALVSAAVSAHADNTVWVSSLDLSKASQGWGSPEADKSVANQPMTIARHVFDHGFGTHAPGMLAIDLKKTATRFTASVGVDDEVPAGRGNVEFEVVGSDRHIMWRSGVMHQGDAAKPVSVDVTGQPYIILRVTTAGLSYDFDHADWADASITTTGESPESMIPEHSDPVISMKPASSAPHINPPYRIGCITGEPVQWSVPATGARPLTFSVKGLPRGLAFDTSTGTFTGRLPKDGDYRVRVAAKNSFGRDDSVVLLSAGQKTALTPPMGWNSYDAFGDNVREAEVLDNARYMKDHLQPYGWDTVVVDYRWYDPGAYNNNANERKGAVLTMDAWGRLLPAPNRFPSAADGAGFKSLAHELHEMGLKFGIHIMRGIPRNAVTANTPIEGSTYRAADAADTSDKCGWCPDMYGVRGDTPAGQAYYDSLFRLYAAWGLDFVKMDDTSSPYHTAEIEAVRRAIDRCGRSIVFSLSPGETPLEQGAHVAAHANMWRESGDFWDNWGSLNHEFRLGDGWSAVTGPGHWGDADMLPLGHLSVKFRSVGPDRQTRFTRSEQVTVLSLWSLLPSPLMLGANLPDNDAWTLSLLTNPEVLALDQDSAGHAAKCISHGDVSEVWERTLSDGSIAVGLFNVDELDGTVSVSLHDLGLSGRYTGRDLWLRKDLGVVPDKLTMSVPAHSAVLIRLKKAQ